jgi:hypothetical protein
MDPSKKLSAAEIQFKKSQRPDAGKKPVSAYETEAIATRNKTERLKALRLARDAAEAAANPDGEAARTPTRTRRKSKSNAGTLSDWLKGQKEDGRNN